MSHEENILSWTQDPPSEGSSILTERVTLFVARPLGGLDPQEELEETWLLA